MALRIQCPRCQSQLQVADEHRGKQVRCPMCSSVMLVPGTSLPARAPTANPSPAPAPASQAITPAAPALARFAPDPTFTDIGRLSPPAARPAKSQAHLRVALTAALKRPGVPWFLAGAGGAVMMMIGLLFLLSGRDGPTPPAAQAKAPVPAKDNKDEQKTSTSLSPAKLEVQPVKVVDPPPQVVEPTPRPVEPPPKAVEPPPGPAPPAIAPTTIRQVKKATAYMRVTLANGSPVQGSGFFAAEPGLVFTNAHVLDMLSAASPLPSKVEVVLNSGDPDEYILTGEVLGVDRSNDLAILRVRGEAPRWPAPLPLDSSLTLTELQKVYIFGFPFGTSIGKNITVSESSVSSLRRAADGSVTQVQVNGGMNPGNSGGPVVDSRGAVVGVAVAIIKGTQINFAVPGDKVQGLLRGHVTEVQFGEPYLDNAQVKLPVMIDCLDALHRIRELRAEVWTGKPGAGRPVSVKPPESAPGDGARRLAPLRYADGKAQGEIVLPTIGGGQVLWVQPALTDGGGVTYWASATPFTPSEYPPLERTPVVLQQRYDTQGERTVKINYSLQMKIDAGGGQLTAHEDLKMEGLESMQADARGGQGRLTAGSCTLTHLAGDRTIPVNPQAQALLPNHAFTVTTDPLGALIQGKHPRLEMFYPAGFRHGFDDLAGKLAHAYEMTCVSVPNRLVQPRETWPAPMRVPLFIFGDGKQEVVELVATCTFEGTRMVQGEKQALFTVTGTLPPPQAGKKSVGGKVAGKVHFGVEKGFLTRADLKLESDATNQLPITQKLEMKLTRMAGNLLRITPAPPSTLRAHPKVIHQSSGVLTPQDPADYPTKPGCYYKTVRIPLTAGETYLVEMNRVAQHGPDPYLVLVDPSGQKVAEDDDSGGNLNALIIYRPAATGEYQIRATSCNAQEVGPFTLRVSQLVAAQARNDQSGK